MVLEGAALAQGDAPGKGGIGVCSKHDKSLGKAPQQKKVAFLDQYPIDQAVRQKEERKAREEIFAEEGLTAAEIKAARKRKKLKQEERHDDCGSDLGPSDEAPMRIALALEASISSSLAYSCFDEVACCSDSAESSEGELDKVLNYNFCLHCLVGSDGYSRHSSPRNSMEIPIIELCIYLSRSDMAGTVDVMELFGGESGVGRLCVRRRLVGGVSFDIVAGFDLTKKEHQEDVLKCVIDFKPLVIVMGLPCTGFGRWSHPNRKLHLETWGKSRQVAECLVEFAARVCKLQLAFSRHLLLEHPVGSELFWLLCFEEIWNTCKVSKIYVPQCALGLRVHGEPMTLLSSSISLLEQFRGATRRCTSHGVLEGSNLSNDAHTYIYIYIYVCTYIYIYIYMHLLKRCVLYDVKLKDCGCLHVCICVVGCMCV